MLKSKYFCRNPKFLNQIYNLMIMMLLFLKQSFPMTTKLKDMASSTESGLTHLSWLKWSLMPK